MIANAIRVRSIFYYLYIMSDLIELPVNRINNVFTNNSIESDFIWNQKFPLQKQVENDGDTLYVGNEGIRMAVQNLKAELHRARHDNSLEINDGEVIEETFATKQGESSGKGQEN